MPNLIVIGHLEQSSDNSGRLFGFTLSVGWSEDNAPPHGSPAELHPLFPWTWKPITMIQLLGKRADGSWVTINQYPVLTPAPLAIDNLTRSAHARYQEKGISVRWPDPTAKIQPLVVNNGSGPWVAQVIELSTSPYPIAQNLNLSFVFSVSETDLQGYSQVAAAPVIAQDLMGQTAMQFGTFQEATASGFVPYTSVGSLSYGVIAVSNLIPTALPTAKDWNPQVQKIPLASVSVADWQASFLQGAARLFSVSDFVHSMVANPPKWLVNRFIPTMIDAGIAALRDSIGLGTELGPSRAFIDFQSILTGNSGLVDELRAGSYDKAFPSLDSWKEFLASRLPTQSAAVIWTSSSKDSFVLTDAQRSDYNARLTREFAAAVAIIAQDDDTTTFSHDLMLAYWDKVLLAMTQTSQAQQAAFRLAVAAQLASPRDYRSAWLDDLAGLFWPNILANPDTADNPYLGRAKALSTLFILKRLGMKLSDSDTPPNLSNSWSWRTVPQDWIPTGSDLAAWQQIGSDQSFRDSIKAWQNSIAANFAPESASVDHSQRNPPPLHLQFAQFSKDSAPSGAVDVASDDFFRSIRGVGLLVREQSSGPWYNVNHNGIADANGHLVSPTPVCIAQRPVYFADLRRSLLTYESAPGSGGTALENIKGLQRVMVSEQTVRDPLLHSTYHEDARAVQLKYGRTFQLTTYGMLNSAILPKEIRANPREPRGSTATVADSTSELLQQPFSYTYQRMTRIGALRIVPDQNLAKEKQNLPVVPGGTFPRGRDLPWDDLWASLSAGIPYTEASLPLALLTPLSWVSTSSPAQSDYTFNVKLPEVSWKEWACWGASLPPRANNGGLPKNVVIPIDSSAFSKDREDIIAESFEKCLPTGADPQYLPALDDPCLERMLYLELLQEIDGVLQSVNTAVLSIQAAEGSSGLAKYRSRGAKILCKHAETSQSSMVSNTATSTVTVQVEAGQVCLLRIWACVPAEYQLSVGNRFSAMFAPSVLGQSVPIKLDNRKYFLLSPYSLIIEGTSDVLPSSEELFRAFSAGYELAESDYTKSFVSARLRAQVVTKRATGGGKFQGTPTDPAYRFLNIGRAEVQRQSWHWDGRPVPLHPVLRNIPATNFADEEQKWIARVYGEVPDRESLKCRMAISKTVPTDPNAKNLDRRGCRSFEFSEILCNSAGPTKADQDLRGAHYRFSLRVFNRYESLLSEAIAVRYAHPVPDFLIPNSQIPLSLAWRSVFVPSRVEEPETPRIRVVLPLTEAYERTESKSPGLLAVFDDIWYDGAGLGESLEVKIDVIEYKGKNYQQAGKDTLLRDRGESPFLDPSRPPATINLSSEEPHPGWTGPVGHFKDFDNRAARFLGSSFIIPAPSVPPSSKNSATLDARNWLANLRFRKVIYSRDLPRPGTASLSSKRVAYSGEAMLNWASTPRYSGWTDAYWVPLLPEFSRFDDFGSTASQPKDYRIATLSARIDSSTGTVTLTNGLAPVHLRPTQSPLHPDGFRLYAVLTQRAYDFRGQYNQEIYMATLAQDANSANWVSPSRSTMIGKITAEYRVRLVEVQLPTARLPRGAWPSDPEDIWDAMLTVAWRSAADVEGDRHSAYDALGRVVRYSEPANSIPRELCELTEVQ
jgi:hypothetical protein